MKFNNLFFMALVLVLICSCKDTTLCYKIPLDNKELVICTTSEAINKSAITAIILLILRSFQRKGLCNSGL